MRFVIIWALALALTLSSCLSADEESKNYLDFEVIDQFGTSGGDGGDKLTLDSRGNIYMVGWTEGSLYGNPYNDGKNIFLVKYGSNGQRQWVEQLRVYLESAAVVGADNEDNVYLGGYLGSPSDDSIESFVAKYNRDGQQQWLERFRCIDSEHHAYANETYVYSMVVDASGNSYLTGKTHCHLKNDIEREALRDIFLIKYNHQGKRQWTKQLLDGEGKYLTLDKNGNVYVLSYGLDNVSYPDPVLIKYDPDGKLLWSKNIDDSNIDRGKAIALDASGDIYVAGNTYDDSIFLAKHSSNGNQLWIKDFKYSQGLGAKDIAIDDRGNLHITGYVYGHVADYENYTLIPDTPFLLKLNNTGEEQWIKQFRTRGAGYGSGLTIAPGGEVYLTGRTEGSFPGFRNQGSNDAFLIKYPGLTVY